MRHRKAAVVTLFLRQIFDFAQGLGISSDVCVLRHGQSTFNQLNLFCGWSDAPLTRKGEEEAQRAADLLRHDPVFCRGFDVIYTSRLSRARRTAGILAEGLGYDPQIVVATDWRLNEQLYGALTGLNKRQAMIEFGNAQVQRWRRGDPMSAPPSSIRGTEWCFEGVVCQGSHECDTDERKYLEIMKGTESFSDMRRRVGSFWTERVLPDLKEGKKIAIVAHGNCLRALIQRIEGKELRDAEVVEIPRAAPLYYRFVGGDIAAEPVSDGHQAISGLKGRFILPSHELALRLSDEQEWLYKTAMTAN